MLRLRRICQTLPARKAVSYLKNNSRRFYTTTIIIIKYFTSYTSRNLPFLFSVLEQLNGKTLVMSLLGHDDPNVRYEALLAVQKLMVHNW